MSNYLIFCVKSRPWSIASSMPLLHKVWWLPMFNHFTWYNSSIGSHKSNSHKCYFPIAQCSHIQTITKLKPPFFHFTQLLYLVNSETQKSFNTFLFPMSKHEYLSYIIHSNYFTLKTCLGEVQQNSNWRTSQTCSAYSWIPISSVRVFSKSPRQPFP